MKKRLIPFAALAMTTAFVAGCVTESTKNSEKPLVFYNRQPTKADNTVDTSVMSWSDKTYYAGFDAAAGGSVQGKMVVDYIKEHAAEMDRNSDKTIGYVLAIGQNSHNDSAARTIGVRTALGTGTVADDTTMTQEGEITANDGQTYKIKELAAKEMRDSSGPWSSTEAGNTMSTWLNQYGTQIDLVVSNNDGMAEGMIGQYGTSLTIPTFGYDANASTLDLIIAGGSMKGTISQNHHAQTLICLQLVRNMLDGLTGDDVHTKGFNGTADSYGNVIADVSIGWDATDKSLLAENAVVTAANAAALKADTLNTGIKQTDAPTKKVLWTVYSSTDNFLNQSFMPTLKRYSGFYNLEITDIYGDGTQESSITNNFINLGNYDAYVVNMVEPTSGALYEGLLSE